MTSTGAIDAGAVLRCQHEPYQGRCAHCDVPFKNGRPVFAALSPTPASETSDLAEIVRRIEQEFPGWWHTSGHCSLSGHASIGPDYNSPEHGERLRREFPIGEFPESFDVDLKDGDNRQAMALLECIEQARAALRASKGTEPPPHPETSTGPAVGNEFPNNETEI